MKVRSLIFWFITVGVVLIVMALWFVKMKSVETLPMISTETNPASSQGLVAGALVHSNMPPVAPAVPATPAPPSPLESKEQRMREGLAELNNEKIVFYGKIQDQFANAVSGAVVNFEVRINNGHESTVKRGNVIADGNGLFTIAGYKGESLGLGVAKAGYVWVSMSGSGIYSKMWPEDQRAHPDPNNPTIIKMWKLQGAEPLTSINLHCKLHYTDAPINFDLLSGKIVQTGGDIAVTVTRAAGIMTGRNRLSWGLQIGAVNGGLIDSTSLGEEVYAAPEYGYQPVTYFNFSTNAPGGWFGQFHCGLFVMSRDGQIYSKLGLSFRINENPGDFMYLTINGVANTNGSRNWEATAPQ